MPQNMQPKNSARYAPVSFKTLGLALASSCMLYSGAEAAGLGKLTVLSALGQPLHAEIELTSVSKDDVGNTIPKLANAEAYKQANVAYSSSLSSLSFSIEERGSRRFVLVTSSQSVNEPFLEILVELNSGSGKLIREYTLLLDPVEMQATNVPMSSSTGTTVSSQPNATSTPLPPIQQQASIVTPKPATSNSVASTKSSASVDSKVTYQIKAGDTLGKIANQYKPQGASLDQMLVALQHSNSSAFIDNNMNLLRSGRVLTIPDAAEIERTNQSEARKIVLAQSNDFNSYRNKFAAQVEQVKPEHAADSKKVDSGKITAKVTETPTPVNEAKDKLKLSKAQLQEQVDKKALEEDKIARQRALDAANARVKELEASTAKLQSILDLKNKAVSSAASKSSMAESGPALAASAPVSAAAPTSMPVIAANAPVSKPTVKPRTKVVVPEPAPQPGFFENLVKYLPYGAAVLAILGVVGLVASKRKKKPEQFDDESILTGSSIKTNSLFGSTGGQSVDTNNSVFNSNFAPSASQLDANEVDPVAEADVYIAYGRDEQAEEILKEALRTQPDRQAVRVKLLEIYAHRKDTRTFETVASELYGMTGGEGPDWAQVASLGAIIDPQNPLYVDGQTSGQHSAALGASTLPVESLDPEVLLGNSLSQEMLDSISAKNKSDHLPMMDNINDRTHRSEEASGRLDFDLGLSTNPEAEDDFGSAYPDNLPTGQAKSPEASMHALNAENQINDQHNFAPAADIPAKPISDAGAEPVAAEESGGMDFADLDFDFDIPKSHAEKLEQVETKNQPNEMPSLHDVTVEQAHKITTPTLDYDLSGIDFDLSKSTETSTDEQSHELPHISGGDGLDRSAPQTEKLQSEETSDIEFSAEMATKLDLAVAYQEIGDKDGARELLEEVLKGGNQEQIAKAKNMMHELA